MDKVSVLGQVLLTWLATRKIDRWAAYHSYLKQSSNYSVLIRSLVFSLTLVCVTPVTATTNSHCEDGDESSLLLPNPVVFVTQFPISIDFAAIGSSFANHDANVASSGRGGDLYIRYTDGRLCNLTREAGFGVSQAFQGAGAIAVRDPVISFDGTRVLFSMVVGAPTEQYDLPESYWQLYELTGGLVQGDDVVITKVTNQPASYNNVMPTYASNGRILFVSDRARNGQRHLYPQHDEYENEVTNTGVWSLNPQLGDLFLLQHSPSGSFSPIVDSYGRVIFTRWDHLQRDQQADSDLDDNGGYGTFDYANESAGASKTLNRVEVFPEPRAESSLITNGNTNLVGLRINHFFPWMIAQDGTGEETLNHIGRHELHDYFTQVFDDDNNLIEFNPAGRLNPNPIDNMFQIEESKTTPGKYYGIDAPEFDTHTSGQIISMQAQPGLSADAMSVIYETHRDTESVTETTTHSANHTGHYRDPLPMSDDSILAAHTSETRGLLNEGSRENPQPRYDFRIKLLAVAGNGYLEPTASITNGISRSVNYWDPDVLVSYNGPMWELNPVEVVSRSVPTLTQQGLLSSPEQSVFDDENVNVAEFKQFLTDQNLALMVVRDATSRDDADEQQPYNLRVPNGGKQVTPSSGTIYDIAHLQYFQADQVRGIGGMAEPKEGRRPLARVLHEQNALSLNVANPLGPAGSVGIQPDGSSAAFVPVRRAMVWQTTDSGGTPVVRERVWITFQPGEIRVCDGCHGINEETQDGQSSPQNSPQALALLLQKWKNRSEPPTPPTDDSFCFPIGPSESLAVVCL